MGAREIRVAARRRETRKRWGENVSVFQRALKQRIHALLMLLPWGADIYRRYFDYKRNLPSFRGVYPSREAADATIADSANASYEFFSSTRNFDDEFAKFDKVFDKSDYPVVFWLSQLTKVHAEVLELGGNVGWAHYSYQKFFEYPVDLRWTIVETPSVIENGTRIARALENRQLDFIENIGADAQAPIFLSSGTLQYLADSLPEIISRMTKLPEHVIINRTPMVDGPEFWTVQNLGPSELPYKVQNRKQLIESMAKLAYEVRDSWNNDRKIEVPFRSKHVVDGFDGVYFKLTRASNQNFGTTDNIVALGREDADATF